ncbi:hypothetical protein GGR52DRAFT_52289 [Hypoxylon sp. FL1284]|nr:hypothetical protein GGR52DRAFT_52289 [Hypoxylon sp. FL1284]
MWRRKCLPLPASRLPPPGALADWTALYFKASHDTGWMPLRVLCTLPCVAAGECVQRTLSSYRQRPSYVAEYTAFSAGFSFRSACVSFARRAVCRLTSLQPTVSRSRIQLLISWSSQASQLHSHARM